MMYNTQQPHQSQQQWQNNNSAFNNNMNQQNSNSLGGSNPNSGNDMSSFNTSSSGFSNNNNQNPATGKNSSAVDTSTNKSSPDFWNPALNMVQNEAVMNMAMASGQQFLASNAARMIPGLELFLTSMRHYFAVDNYYVKQKIIRVLFPFLRKNWNRGLDETNTQFQKPIHDENAPDLYLPSMSMLTYVLLCGLMFGSKGEFTPEALPQVTWRCLGTQTVEVLCIRLGYYVMQAPCSFLDLFSFTGYKYLGLCINMLVGLFGGYKGYNYVLIWTASAAAYFMLKTLSNNIPKVTSGTGPKREVMIIVFAASQLITMWWLGQTKYLE